MKRRSSKDLAVLSSFLIGDIGGEESSIELPVLRTETCINLLAISVAMSSSTTSATVTQNTVDSGKLLAIALQSTSISAASSRESLCFKTPLTVSTSSSADSSPSAAQTLNLELELVDSVSLRATLERCGKIMSSTASVIVYSIFLLFLSICGEYFSPYFHVYLCVVLSLPLERTSFMANKVATFTLLWNSLILYSSCNHISTACINQKP
ncbi:hypothetical protein AMTRI_Chr11g155590 [Amborella trichopoda]